MLEDALLDLTNRGDFVLDPFLGSGSTLIAAENTGRICRGVELDPLYVDVIVRRYEAASGEAAVLVPARRSRTSSSGGLASGRAGSFWGRRTRPDVRLR
jgi:DNA modification methylase